MRDIVDHRVLEVLEGLPVFAVEFQGLDVDLDLMARHLLLISLSMDLANSRAAEQSAETIAPENAIHARIGDGDDVITRQPRNWRGEILGSCTVNFGQVVQPEPTR